MNYYYDTPLFVSYMTNLNAFILLVIVIYFIYKLFDRTTTFPCDCSSCQKKQQVYWKQPLTFKRLTYIVVMIMLSASFIHFYDIRENLNGGNIKKYNPYEVLGLRPDSTMDEINKRFQLLCKSFMLSDMNSLKYRKLNFQERAYKLIRNEKLIMLWKKQYVNSSNKPIVALPELLNPTSPFIKFYLAFYIILLVFGLPLGTVYFAYSEDDSLDPLTITLFEKLPLTPSFAELIEVIAASREVQKHIIYNTTDTQTLPLLLLEVQQDLIKPPRYQCKEVVKAQTLICCHISRVELSYQLKRTLYKILPETERVIDGMIGYYYTKNSLPACKKCVAINQMICQACTSSTQYYQLPEFRSVIEQYKRDNNEYNDNKIDTKKFIKGKTVLELSREAPTDRLELLESSIKDEKILKLWKNYLMFYPGRIYINASVNPTVSDNSANYFQFIIKFLRRPCQFTVINTYDSMTHDGIKSKEIDNPSVQLKAHTPHLKEIIEEQFYLFVYLENASNIIYMKKMTIPLSNDPSYIKLTLDAASEIRKLDFNITIMSCCYVDCEISCKKRVELRYD